jgi:hypothetical protein
MPSNVDTTLAERALAIWMLAEAQDRMSTNPSMAMEPAQVAALLDFVEDDEQ